MKWYCPICQLCTQGCFWWHGNWSWMESLRMQLTCLCWHSRCMYNRFTETWAVMLYMYDSISQIIFLLHSLQHYLKNVIQALISSQTSWQSNQGSNVHHSFGHGPSSRPLLYPEHPLPTAYAGVQKNVQRLGVREAEAIRLASLNVPVREKEPLNLFHLRDALKVYTVHFLEIFQ